MYEQGSCTITHQRSEQDLKKDNIRKKGFQTAVCVLCILTLLLSGCSDRTEDFLKTSGEPPGTLTDSAGDDPEQDPSGREPEQVYVYVCGAVAAPGVYILPEGSRVYQAVEAAGGFLPEAAQEIVNQAQPVFDGQQLFIPFLEAAGEETESRYIAVLPDDGRIDLNSASEEELCTLPGIGEAKAQAILSYREEHGSFSSVEELMQVEGIKEGIYNKIQDKITVR